MATFAVVDAPGAKAFEPAWLAWYNAMRDSANAARHRPVAARQRQPLQTRFRISVGTADIEG